MAVAARVLSGKAPARALRSFVDRTSDIVTLKGDLADGGMLQNNGSAPSLAVLFNCPRPGSFAVELDFELFPVYQPYHPVPVSFVKICGGSSKPGFHVGLSPGGQEIIKDGALVGDHPGIDNVADSSVVHVAYTPLSMADPDQSPQATVRCVDADGVSIVDLTVEATAEMIRINYECVKPGLAFCELQFSLHMWQAPSPIRWGKDCGGMRKDVVVTSNLEKYPVAFANGKVHPDWQVHLPWDEDTLDLTVNASVPVTMKAHVQSELKFTVTPETAEVGGDGVTFKLATNCTGHLEGQYPNSLTLQMDGYEPVEVPFEKTCKKPEFVQFADSETNMLVTTVILVIVVGIPLSIVAFCIVRSLRGNPA
jgi:hypothetical protein